MEALCKICGRKATYQVILERVAINLCPEHATNLMLSPKMLRRRGEKATKSSQLDLDACAQLILDNLANGSDFGVQVLIGICMGVITEARMRGVTLNETTITKATEEAKKFYLPVNKDIESKT